MSVPQVVITQLDNQLGVSPPSLGRAMAIVGPCTGGIANTPVKAARPDPLIAELQSGAAAEVAASWVSTYGRPCVVVPTTNSVAATYSALTKVGGGTSVITAGASAPLDSYECAVKFPVGGTIATPGITYQTSLDGGESWGPVTALGSANTLSLGSGVGVALGAGTIVAGTVVTFRTKGPMWSTANLSAALDVLKNNKFDWEIVTIVGDADGAAIDAVGNFLMSLEQQGKYRSAIMHVRVPEIAESDSTYQGVVGALIASKSDTRIEVVAGACKRVSSISRRNETRPAMFVTAPWVASLSPEQNPAEPSLGSLRCSITDSLDNLIAHDELVLPGLDDMRFSCLRTLPGYEGVFMNRARLISASGSDFSIHPYRRVMNVGLAALFRYASSRLNKVVYVDKKTGFIREKDRFEIERGATSALETALLTKPMASGVVVNVSGSDNVLSTKTITFSARIIPVGYSEYFNITVGFTNPASVVAL